MDRAEVLHTPSYDIREGWKIGPGQNELVLPSENPTFPPDLPYIVPTLTATQHAHWPYRILLSKRQAVSTSHFCDRTRALILRGQSDFAYFDVNLSQETSIFYDFMTFADSQLMVQNLDLP